MVGAMRIPLVLVILGGLAHADPLQITSANLEHNGAINVAAGDKQFLVLWEEQEAAHLGTRHLAAAIVDETGKLVVGPTRYLDGGGMPNDVHAVWTGTAFTVAICNEHWGDDHRIVWGTLDAKLAWTQQGEWKRKADDGYQLYCSNAAPSGGGGMVLAVTATQEIEDGGGGLTQTCGSWHMLIVGTKLTDGRRVDVCGVTAIDKDYLIGSDPKHRLVAATAKKQIVVLRKDDVVAKIASPELVALEAGGFVVYRPGGKPVASKPVAMAKGPIGAAQVDRVFAIGDQLGLEAHTPTGLELAIYKRDGSLARADIVSKANMVQHRCTAGAGAILCAWQSQDKKTLTGDIFVQRLALP